MDIRDFFCCLPALSNARLVGGAVPGPDLRRALNMALTCDRTIHCQFRLTCSCLASQVMESLMRDAAA
ncbi:hypothetical protein MTBLM5_10209 [Magnetospirillum sp. LM-5]|uniref:hypothetical protein n=1 Tax=Magnetospirillum sp. LM-5 TaxID=2681466 RepID=UPI00137F7E35|nr:hypothetical protein [Magnetospirillum sp. LM-5]CAA7611830.1 hypothetical protein MTBLM5_10209 [Magnetospirillum sp. LM-5]